MYVFLSVIYYFCIVLFMIAYATCFVINLVRAIKVKKEMLQDCATVPAKVVEVIQEKKRVFIKVEYASPINRTKFINIFEFTKKEFNDQYYVDQEITLYYPKVDHVKRVTCFPVYLAKDQIKVKASNLFVDGLLTFVSMFMVGWFTSLIISLKGFYLFNDNNTTAEVAMSCNMASPLIYLLVLFMFITTVPYMVERLLTAPQDENQSYLKLYGVKCMAEVKTFKFSRAKDTAGRKESLLQIEFYDNKGELIKANLNSYLYTETQEQYINILYDIKNPKNVVYMRR